MRDEVTIKFKKVHPDAKIPTYAHKGDAGMDVVSIEDKIVLAGERALISTGLVAEIPEGHEIQVRPRSGLALKAGITVLNTPGTVDAGYRGVIGVILMNHSHDPFNVSKGDRIAQLVVNKLPKVKIEEVSEVDNTERSECGFGSTGVRA